MRRRMLLPLALCALSQFARTDAHAQSATVSRFYHDRAVEAQARGDTAEALRFLILEYQTTPNPRNAINIARLFEALNRLEEAHASYMEALASDALDPDTRQLATVGAEALRPRLALIDVQTNPPGAEIYVDRVELGSFGTSPRLVAMPAGTRHLTLIAPRRHPREVVVEAVRGKTVPATAMLELITGDLIVTGPVGATAEIVDTAQVIQAKGPVPLESHLAPGGYEVRVSGGGHAPWRGLTAIEAGKTTRFVSTPQPLPPPAGALTVTSNRMGALVEIDNEPVGFAPLAISELPVGGHRVRVSDPGFVSWDDTLDVVADHRTWAVVSLEPPITTRRSTWAYAVGGLGAIALVSSAGTGLYALSQKSDFEDNVDSHPTRARDALESSRTFGTVTDALWISGLTLLATGVVIGWVTEAPDGRPPSVSVSRSEQ